MSEKVNVKCAWCRQQVTARRTKTGEWIQAQHLVRLQTTGLLIYCMGSSELVEVSEQTAVVNSDQPTPPVKELD